MKYIIPNIDSCINHDQTLPVLTQYALENNTSFDFRQCANASDLGVITSADNVAEFCASVTYRVGEQWLYQCQGYSESFLITIESVEASSISCDGDFYNNPVKLAYASDKPFPKMCIVTGLTPQQDCWVNVEICTEYATECNF
ncbi:MAG: hypothetical protein Q8Q33_01700 [Chlamydiota bacterium]|nr:hypothetical protein [Chlamydiota bacterium]